MYIEQLIKLCACGKTIILVGNGENIQLHLRTPWYNILAAQKYQDNLSECQQNQIDLSLPWVLHQSNLALLMLVGNGFSQNNKSIMLSLSIPWGDLFRQKTSKGKRNWYLNRSQLSYVIICSCVEAGKLTERFTSSLAVIIIPEWSTCIANDFCGSKSWNDNRVFEYSIPHMANQTYNKKGSMD